ncbi:MAG: insulinase family protein [Ignavibacteria bacterium]|nr:insulinase family protein [Ignavibacteria bacterium]
MNYSINKQTQKLMYRLLFILSVVLLVSSSAAIAQSSKKKSSKKTPVPTKIETTDPAAKKQVLSIDEQPEPSVGTAFEFPAYDEFTTPSGLKVVVVENHDLPAVSIRMSFKGGEAYDPKGKEGTASVMVDMLGKGTKTKTAQEIATELDGIGASLSFSTAGESMSVTGYSLKKHVGVVLNMLGDQLKNPVFDEVEMEKLIKQYVANIANSKTRPMDLAQGLSRKVIYGMDNMLARRQTEKSIQKVTKKDIVDFYTNYLRPNNAAISFVGDVTAKEVKELLSKYFNGWNKGNIPEVKIDENVLEPAGVYFIARKGAVQSGVIVCSPAPAYTDPEWEKADVLAEYFGSGFGSILFSTLRETYSYCYSPFGFVTGSKRYNRIASGAEVRSSVTDSALNVIMREMRRVVYEGPEEPRLARRVAYMAGTYKMAFERPATVATLAMNAWLSDISMDRVKGFLHRIESTDVGSIHEMARKLYNPFNQRIIVVGNPDVREKLEQFGPVYDYNTDLEPVADAPIEAVSISAEDLIAKYKMAIGGPAVDGVKTVTLTAKMMMTMQGNTSEGSYSRILKMPNMEKSTIEMPGFKQSQWVDGTNAWVSMQDGQAGEAGADEKQQLLLEARAFPILSWMADGYKLTIAGKKNGQIIVNAVSSGGRNETYYFDAETFLLTKSEKEVVTPQGSLVVVDRFENYTTVEGVKFPGIVRTQNQYYSMVLENEYMLNSVVDDATFSPANE